MLGKILKSIFAKYLYYLGGLQKHIRNLQSSDCIVGIYDHNPNDADFERYIKWLLNKGFEFATYEDVLEFKLNGSIEGCKVWFSFDDGWRGNLKLKGILEKYDIQVTLFITTQAIERGFFRDSLESNYRELLPEQYRNNHKRLKTISDKLRSEIDEKLFSEIPKNSKREALTKDDIKNLSNYKEFCIQAHTHTHPNLLMVESEDISKEIKENISLLKDISTIKVTGFSFPYGRYDDSIADKVSNCGIDIMVSVSSGFITKDIDGKVYPRNGIANASFHENCCRMLDFWYPNTKKYKGLFSK